MNFSEEISAGIDLGTTCCCVAVWDNTGPSIVETASYERVFPSTITINGDVWSIGKHKLTDYPRDEVIIHGTKHVIGRKNSDKLLQQDIDDGQLPFRLSDRGEPYCQVGDRQITPEEITALFILEANKMVREKYGKNIGKCAIAVPVYFSDAQRQATLAAAKIAGLKSVTLIHEPTAIALAYIYKNTEIRDGEVFVVDVGGSTTDCATVSLKTSSEGQKLVNISATSGNTRLGGNSFLSVLTRIIKEKLGGRDVSNQDLLRCCETGKNAWRNPDADFSFNVNGLELKVSQEEFKRGCADHFHNLRGVISEALRRNRPGVAIIAGGATVLKTVEQFITNELKDAKLLNHRPPREAVAEGAILFLKQDNLCTMKTVPLSLGILAKSGNNDYHLSVIIPKGELIPARRCFTYHTLHKPTAILLYEGNHAQAFDNDLVDQFYLDVDVGVAIDVTITLTIEEVKVEAKQKGDGSGECIIVKRNRAALTDSELETKRHEVSTIFEMQNGSAKGDVRQMNRRKRKAKSANKVARRKLKP